MGCKVAESVTVPEMVPPRTRSSSTVVVFALGYGYFRRLLEGRGVVMPLADVASHPVYDADLVTAGREPPCLVVAVLVGPSTTFTIPVVVGITYLDVDVLDGLQGRRIVNGTGDGTGQDQVLIHGGGVPLSYEYLGGFFECGDIMMPFADVASSAVYMDLVAAGRKPPCLVVTVLVGTSTAYPVEVDTKYLDVNVPDRL